MMVSASPPTYSPTEYNSSLIHYVLNQTAPPLESPLLIQGCDNLLDIRISLENISSPGYILVGDNSNLTYVEVNLTGTILGVSQPLSIVSVWNQLMFIKLNITDYDSIIALPISLLLYIEYINIQPIYVIDHGGSGVTSPRFLNSFPNCNTTYSPSLSPNYIPTDNYTAYREFCMAADDVPVKSYLECSEPITERCVDSYVYNASCWLPEWTVDNFTISGVSTVTDCSFDANHWFTVGELLLNNLGSCYLPSRVVFTTNVTIVDSFGCNSGTFTNWNDARYLPITIANTSSFVDGSPLTCSTSCVSTISNLTYLTDPEATDGPFPFYHIYPNWTEGASYPNGTNVTFPASALVFSNSTGFCYAQPTYALKFENLPACPCSTISKQNIVEFTWSNINCTTLNSVKASQVTIQNNLFLTTANVTLTPSMLYVYFISNPQLREINLFGTGPVGVFGLLGNIAYTYLNISSVNSIALVGLNQCGNLMAIELGNISSISVLETQALERIDIGTMHGLISIDTRGERFLNSRPGCIGFEQNLTWLEANCLPVPDGLGNLPPKRLKTECSEPITERCANPYVYNASCWLPEWNLDNFTMNDENVIPTDCPFDANHWFVVNTLYVWSVAVPIPARIIASQIVYSITESPTHNPSKNPSKSPSTFPTKNPTKVPTKRPSKLPTTNAPTATLEYCGQYGVSVLSVYGTRCDICSRNGYYSEGKCICYSRQLDPYQNCQWAPGEEQRRRLGSSKNKPVVHKHGGRRLNEFRTLPSFSNRRRLDEFRRLSTIGTPVTIRRTSVKCICPFDDTNGFFKVISQFHKFGTPNPPICDQCSLDIIGPKPLSNPPGAYDKPCTLLGGPDPNYANTTLAWQSCSNHGYWNKTSCVCNRGWTLGKEMGEAGIGFFSGNSTYNVTNTILKTCDQCEYNYGPTIPFISLELPQPISGSAGPFCTKVYTPDEHGEPRECGGKGTYIYGICHCNFGYTLTAFENVYTCV